MDSVVITNLSDVPIDSIKHYISVYGYNRQLPSSSIDDNVIKTFPQTLSDDAKNQVKENLGITDAVTPDWNAKEGEAGYIDNRTHYEYDSMSDTPLAKVLMPLSLTDAPSIKLLKTTKYETPHSLKFYIFQGSYNIAYNELAEVTWNFVENNQYTHTFDFWSGGCMLTIKLTAYCECIPDGENSEGEWVDGHCDYYVKLESIYNEGYESFANEYFYFYEPTTLYKKLDDKFIPDNVLKTTPQILPDNYKNQALANLGIDPVVWKYVCNPINVIAGEDIPDELKIHIGDDRWRLKYLNTAMYACNGILPISISDSKFLTFKLADGSQQIVSVGEGFWEF